MRCPACDSESWYQTGKKVHNESEILICFNCGYVTHKVDPAAENDMIQYYRGLPYTDSKGVFHKSGYRPGPNHLNLITTNNKTNYVKIFLEDFLKEHQSAPMIVGDVGCATGYMLNLFRSLGHKATGCEYTVEYRRFCENFYGIPISEELPKKYQYDLIIIYHVFEHMIEPDKKLMYYRDMLKEGGYMLIATPEWFGNLQQSAETGISTFEHLFHKDHINLFSATAIKNIFHKCGFKIVKEDHLQYGQTYLIQKLKADEKSNLTFKNESWDKKLKYMQSAKIAIDMFIKKQYREAIQVMPKFPDAWMRLIFMDDRKDPQKQMALIQEMNKAGLGKESKCVMGVGQFHYQQQQYEEALKHFEIVFKLKPFGDLAMYIGFCHWFLGDYIHAKEAFMTAQALSPNKWTEAMDWACKCASTAKAWDERLKDSFMEKLEKEKGLTPTLVDRFMEEQNAPPQAEPEKPKDVIVPEIVPIPEKEK